MTIDDTVEQLKDKAREMTEYYYKGLVSDVSAIVYGARNYLDGEEIFKERAYDLLLGIEEHYSKIPFDKIEEKGEFHPLFVVRGLLHVFRDYVDELFVNENDVLPELEKKYSEIVSQAHLYRDNLQNVLRSIRSSPDYKDYTIEIEGPNGITWDICDLTCV